MVSVASLSGGTVATSDLSSASSAASLPIRRDHRGDHVRQVQRALNATLGTRLAVDGHYGSISISAMKRFQKSVGLRADGRVDQASWNALGLG
jgi:peptidoglycan hydrolase-like protein with peptidoglycan-binding domain